MIQEELTKVKPMKFISSCIVKSIALIIAKANRIPTLAGNLQKIIDFVTPCIQ
jgi:hypothetical protein